jgi:predicted GNAT family acetyltransferase
MEVRDLQIGDTWTAPAHRDRGLATAAILFAAREVGGEGIGFWYVVASDNLSSRRVVEKLGFRPIAKGVRTRRFGTSFLGQYVIESGE